MSEKRDKCWRFSKSPDDKNDNNWYLLAFVNGRGACSLTRFEASNGRHLKTVYDKGDFQDNFADWLNPVSFPLYPSRTINLVKARKEGLPVWAVSEIKKQIIELANSALSALSE
jgi:hypothetical protein